MLDHLHVRNFMVVHPDGFLEFETVEAEGISYALNVIGCGRYFVHQIEDNRVRLLTSPNGVSQEDAEKVFSGKTKEEM